MTRYLAVLVMLLLGSTPASRPAREARTLSGTCRYVDPLTGVAAVVMADYLTADGRLPDGRPYRIRVYLDERGAPTRVVALRPTRKTDVVGYDPRIVEEER